MAAGSPLRIAHVSPVSMDLYGHPDETGWGTEIRYFLTNLVAALARAGDRHTVHLLTSGTGRRITLGEEATGAGGNPVDVVFHPCVQPPRSAAMELRFARQFSLTLLRTLRRERVDVIHLQGARSVHPWLGLIGARAVQQGIPLVVQDQGSRTVGRIEGAAQRYGLRHSAAVLAANSESVRVFAELGVPPARIRFVPHGVDKRIFYPGPERRRDPEAPLRVLFVGRLTADKDPVTFADGVAELARRGLPVSATVISRGALREEVGARLRAAAVPVTFIDHVPQTELVHHYHDADVLVLTSPYEGWNNVTMEAMASGTPVVATDAPGVTDGVQGAGVLIPIRGVTELADALQWLATDEHERLGWRKLGLERAGKYDWDVIAGDLQGIYHRVSTGAPP